MALIDGTTGNDILNGTVDADVINGLAGDDGLSGFAGNDSLDGSDGNDSLEGGAGNDTLVGGNGTDVAFYFNATAGVNVNLATGLATGGAGADSLKGIESVVGSFYNDVLVGDAEANTLSGGMGNDSISGGGGNDTLIGGGGKDTIDGGAGNDTLVLEGWSSTYTVARVNATDVRFTNGTDSVLVRNVEMVTVDNGSSTLSMPMGIAAPVLNITAGNDNILGVLWFGSSIDGLAGNDTIWGGVGRDTLIGGKGDDLLIGRSGDDIYEVDSLNDVVQEEASQGVDLVNVKLTSGNYTLGANVENGTVTATGAVGLIGNELANVLTGGAGANTLDGKAGNDTLIGGAGNDTLIGGLGDDSMTGGAGNDTYEVDSLADVVSEAANGGTDTVNVNIGTLWATYTLGANVENANMASGTQVILVGNDLANTLTGNDEVNWLNGGKGVDRLIGGKGDDIYTVDVAGDVIVEDSVDGGVDRVHVQFTSKGTYTLAANVEEGYIESNAALLVNLTGNASDNYLEGNAGTNVLVGGAGNDTLVGRGSYVSPEGPDTLDGGVGTDAAWFDGNFADYVVARPSGTDVRLTNKLTGSVTIARNIEYFSFEDSDGGIALVDLLANTASSGNDPIDGTEFDDSLDGMAGNDTLNGLDGNDTLIGGAGNDSLTGGLGDDRMDGGAGNDTYEVDSINDIVVEGANAGTDLVNVSIVSPSFIYRLAANVENGALTSTGEVDLFGNAANNALTGNDANNYLDGDAGNDTLTGNAGDDTLIGVAGNDRLVGGVGDDFYVINSTSDVVVELDGGGVDLVALDSSALPGTYMLAAFVENVAAAAFTTTTINITGNVLNNIVQGNMGNNVLLGGAGDDTLVGLGGDDTLDGGAGTDSVVLSGSLSDYFVTRMSATDVLFARANPNPLGADPEFSTLVRNVEKIQFSDSVGNITTMDLATATAGPVGTSAANTLTGGAGTDRIDGGAGNDSINGMGGNDLLRGGIGNDLLDGGDDNDVLEGGAGNDSLLGGAGDDTLNGGAGLDTLKGGAGDDRYVVDAAGDVIVENAGEGNDKVSVLLTSGTYVLAANVEDASIDSTGAVSLKGNDADNSLVGNAANNKIEGGAGNDKFFSGLGNDTLTGGAGNDEFHFNELASSTNKDTITDFIVGEDRIFLNTSVFTSLGAGGTQGDLSGPYLNYNATTGALTYDADGTEPGAAVTIAVLGAAGARPALTNADIWLI